MLIVASCSGSRPDCESDDFEIVDLGDLRIEAMPLRLAVSDLITAMGAPDTLNSENDSHLQLTYPTRGVSFHVSDDTAVVSYVNLDVLRSTISSGNVTFSVDSRLGTYQSMFPTAYACRRTYAGGSEGDSAIILAEQKGEGWVTLAFEGYRLVSLDYTPVNQ